MIHISSTQRNSEKEADIPFENNAIQDEEDSMQEQAIEMRKLFKERETKLMSELQDARDQAELLEFRVLELEEEQEKVLVRIDISFVNNSIYYNMFRSFGITINISFSIISKNNKCPQNLIWNTKRKKRITIMILLWWIESFQTPCLFLETQDVICLRQQSLQT